MSSTWGNHIKISIFGESHSKGIGIVIDGVPAGTVIDFSSLLLFMARRSSKGGKLDTPRLEKDFPQIQSGLLSDPKDPNRLIACGTPICALIENTNTQSKDYDQLRSVARPGHAITPVLSVTMALMIFGAEDIFPDASPHLSVLPEASQNSICALLASKLEHTLLLSALSRIVLSTQFW